MIFHVIGLMYVAYVYINQSLFVEYIPTYKFDILQIFKSTVYPTRIISYLEDIILFSSASLSERYLHMYH